MGVQFLAEVRPALQPWVPQTAAPKEPKSDAALQAGRPYRQSKTAALGQLLEQPAYTPVQGTEDEIVSLVGVEILEVPAPLALPPPQQEPGHSLLELVKPLFLRDGGR